MTIKALSHEAQICVRAGRLLQDLFPSPQGEHIHRLQWELLVLAARLHDEQCHPMDIVDYFTRKEGL